MLPVITKRPPKRRMSMELRLATKEITGIRMDKYLMIANRRLRAFVLASINLLYSCCRVFSTRIRAAPKMLSLITLFNQSIIPCTSLKNFLIFFMITERATQITDTSKSTSRASFQLVINNSILAPVIKQ